MCIFPHIFSFQINLTTYCNILVYALIFLLYLFLIENLLLYQFIIFIIWCLGILGRYCMTCIILILLILMLWCILFFRNNQLAGSDENKSAIVEKGGMNRLIKLSARFAEDPSVLQEVRNCNTYQLSLCNIVPVINLNHFSFLT